MVINFKILHSKYLKIKNFKINNHQDLSIFSIIKTNFYIERKFVSFGGWHLVYIYFLKIKKIKSLKKKKNLENKENKVPQKKKS